MTRRVTNETILVCHFVVVVFSFVEMILMTTALDRMKKRMIRMRTAIEFWHGPIEFVLDTTRSDGLASSPTGNYPSVTMEMKETDSSRHGCRLTFTIELQSPRESFRRHTE